MILFPAVDIKDGQCVRLAQGREDAVTVFAADPVSQARYWEDQGARAMHVVDLDGAFSGKPKNFELIRDLCAAVDVPVQLGGGIRDAGIAEAYFEAGVHRLIIGTMALEDPERFADLCARWPGRIGVSLDARDGKLKTKGWVEDAGLTVEDVLPRLQADGAAFIVYTDISRDGMQSGVNVEAMAKLCDACDLPVVAAGGVTNMDDVRALAPLGPRGLEGIITGRAIYVGTLNIKDALAFLNTL